jgi:hypothetical protein
MKDMFQDDDKIPWEVSEEKRKLEKSGEIATSSRARNQGKQNKYYATSVAVRAIFSEETNHDTRKFLGRNAEAPTPMISGKSKRRNHLEGVDAERSQMSNLTPLTTSLASPSKGLSELSFSFWSSHSFPADQWANESLSTALAPLDNPNSPLSPTIKDFKSLFSHDAKEHPRNAAPKFNPSNSLLYRRSESIEKTLNSEVLDRAKLTRGLSKSFIMSRQHSSLSRQPTMEIEPEEFLEDSEPEPSEQTPMKALPLNVNTKSKLMSLVVQRSKAKYQKNHM